MIIWPTLEQDIKGWLEDLGEKTTDDTAAFFANSYAQAVSAGTDAMMNAVIPPGKESAIESAWAGAFAAQANADQPLGPGNWMPVDAAIVAYWTAAQFSPAIPHPPTIAPLSNMVVFPGAPGGIAPGIDAAFKKEEAGAVAAELVKTYESHIGTVQGIYMGLIPPLASTPTPVPWTGIN